MEPEEVRLTGREWAEVIPGRADAISQRLFAGEKFDEARGLITTAGLMEAVASGCFADRAVTLTEIAERLAQIGCDSVIAPAEAARMIAAESDTKQQACEIEA